MGDVNRDVADHPYPPSGGVLLQLRPLPEELPLNEFAVFDIPVQARSPVFHAGRLAGRDFRFPSGPDCFASVRVLQRHEKGEVIQPDFVGTAKILVVGPFCSAGACPEVVRRLPQPFRLPGDDASKVDGILRELWRIPDVGAHQQSLVHELLETDQEGIAGEGGEKLIRRVTEPGGSERQHLP